MELTMAEEKKQKTPTLTDLTQVVKALADELVRHTDGRNYLFRVATGEIAPPVLNIGEFSMQGKIEDGPRFDSKVLISGQMLDQDTLEFLLASLIEQEEKIAVACWQRLGDVVTHAATLIKQNEERRIAAEKAAREGEPPRDILPFPQQQQQQPEQPVESPEDEDEGDQGA
jgi:hypothetical protein